MQLLLGAYEVSNRAQNIPHPVQYLDCVPSRRNVQVRGIQAVLQAISMSLPRQEGNKKTETPQPLPTTYQPINRAATLGFPRRQRSQKDVF
ncbi:hypothetical protein HYQ44_017721 [Verticillium longisporum]|nr:hypothetical protein HYQ44_017721 [Verticillium longisporum]